MCTGQCLLAQGACSVPLTISALWHKEHRASTSANWTKTRGMPRSSSPNERFTKPPTGSHPQTESVKCRGKYVAFLLTESERSTFKWNGGREIGMVYISEELIQKGMSLITAVYRDFSFCHHSLLCVLHLLQVREGGKSIWHDLQWSKHVGNHWRLGWNQCSRGRHMLHTCLAISHEMQPGTNWTWPAGSRNRPKSVEQQGGRDGKRVRNAEGIERVVGCEVILPHRVFY